MKNKQINIAFLWHMHQPYYKDPVKDSCLLPWVRLHGTKDYLDMVAILDNFPEIRQNFNIVPCLANQIQELTQRSLSDYFLELSKKKPDELSLDEKKYLLKFFFLANYNHMIKPFPRFRELYSKRGLNFNQEITGRALQSFTDQDFLDLQVVFNLAWIDPSLRKADTEIYGLVSKAGNYSHEEKIAVLDKHLEILEKIIDTYRRFQDKGQIELSTTPFYHPITPLLLDPQVAGRGMPAAKLPAPWKSWRSDALAQIQKAIFYHGQLFGKTPEGMWPAEGGVSEEFAALAAESGITWIATDEEILWKTLNSRKDRLALYHPYVLETEVRGEARRIHVVFRDHVLSDLVGFVYSKWNPLRAAKDMVRHFLNIRGKLPDPEAALISVILDGENAWEYYENDGYDFLYELYRIIEKDPRLRTVKIKDAIDDPKVVKKKLRSIFPGSWINGDFHIWIGSPPANLAWDYLRKTREFLCEFEKRKHELSPEIIKGAWEEIYIAEGSDWFWWYSPEHVSDTEEEFDYLFRAHLIKVYEILGEKPPSYLLKPVASAHKGFSPFLEPVGFITPIIDGNATHYYEWYLAGKYRAEKDWGSMHPGTKIIKDIYFGFDLNLLFLRLDPVVSDFFSSIKENYTFIIDIHVPEKRFQFVAETGKAGVRDYCLFKLNQSKLLEKIQESKESCDLGLETIMEIKIPFSLLGVGEGEEIAFDVHVQYENSEIEKIPVQDYIHFKSPSKNFELEMWSL